VFDVAFVFSNFISETFFFSTRNIIVWLWTKFSTEFRLEEKQNLTTEEDWLSTRNVIFSVDEKTKFLKLNSMLSKMKFAFSDILFNSSLYRTRKSFFFWSFLCRPFRTEHNLGRKKLLQKKKRIVKKTANQKSWFKKVILSNWGTIKRGKKNIYSKKVYYQLALRTVKSSLLRAKVLNCILDNEKKRKKPRDLPVKKHRFLIRERDEFLASLVRSSTASQRKLIGKLRLCVTDFKTRYRDSNFLNFSRERRPLIERNFICDFICFSDYSQSKAPIFQM